MNAGFRLNLAYRIEVQRETDGDVSDVNLGSTNSRC
jgi:hypothetical protein